MTTFGRSSSFFANIFDFAFLLFYILIMLLQLEETQKDNVNKLLEFAKKNHLNLVIDKDEHNYVLPGKPLTAEQLQQLIENSRKSGHIFMQHAHEIIRNSYNAD